MAQCNLIGWREVTRGEATKLGRNQIMKDLEGYI